MKASTPKKLKKPNSTTTRLNRLGKDLRVRIVTAASEIESFDQRLAQQHYLGATPPVGDFLRQVVEREGQAVGQLVWGAASLKVKDREEWIGWTPSQRAERLKLVVQNRRYLLLHPKGQEPNLASQVLAAACRALPEQWQERFGYRPLLAETFSDVESFAGTCYKASGWEPVGLTKGHSRHRADFYVPNGRPKRLWMKELCPAGRQKARALHLDDALQQALTPPPNGLLPLNPQQSRSLWEVLRTVTDPRASNTRFRIGSVLTLVVMALLSGARDVSQIARFATRLQPKQRAALNLPIKKGTRRFYAVPGYSVFYDLLKQLDPEVLARVVNGWLREHAGTLPSSLSLDGKMIRDIVGTVTLADHQNGSPVALAIMDQKEGTQRCEQTAALALIQSLPTLEGQTLTADPLHCQRELAKVVVGKGGEYLFQIKGNQKKLLAHARRQCAGEPPPFVQTTPGHGRVDERGVILCEVQPMAIDFPFARTIVGIQSRRTEKRSGKTTFETRYYLSSQDQNERTYEGWIDLIRGHWAGVENRNHWRRDAIWGEDGTRSRKPNIVANLALLRSAAVELLNHDYPDRSHSDLREAFASDAGLSLALLRSKS